MLLIRIGTAVALTLYLAAVPAQAQFWGNNGWGNNGGVGCEAAGANLGIVVAAGRARPAGAL